MSSKESLGPSKQEGEKILLSGLLDGFLILAEDLNQRKEWLPLRPQRDCLQRRPDNNHCQLDVRKMNQESQVLPLSPD